MDNYIGAIILLSLTGEVSAVEFDVKSYLDKTYIKIGAGYKFIETTTRFDDNSDGVFKESDDPISARIEAGYQYSKNLSFGISHHSQWFTSWPQSEKGEYSKTEIFIDYTFTLGDLL
jgi:hypothetical protein